MKKRGEGEVVFSHRLMLRDRLNLDITGYLVFLVTGFIYRTTDVSPVRTLGTTSRTVTPMKKQTGGTRAGPQKRHGSIALRL